MARLQAFTSALSRAPGRQQVVAEVLRHGAEALGATAGIVAGVDRAGTALEVLGSFGLTDLPDGKRLPLELELPLTEAARRRSVILLGDVGAVPLMVDGRLLGALQLSFAEGRHPRDLDGDLFLTVAELTAQALERAALYDDLQQSEQLFRTLTEAAHQHIWIEGPDRRIQYLNRHAREYFEVSLEELRATETAALRDRFWHPDDIAALSEQASAAKGEQRLIDISVRLRRHDGVYRTHIIRAVPLRDAAGNVLRWIGTATDVEDLLQAQASERDHAALLEQERKFRERLMGIVGHDLRNPLAAISSWAQLLEMSPTLSEGDHKAIARIGRTIERMRRMITQLLDFTRARQAGGIPVRARTTDLEAICRAVVEEFSSSHPGRLVLDVEGDLLGEWDADRLAQMLSNLVGNGLQHGEGLVSVRAVGEPANVRIQVHNRGPSIPASELPHVFDPYRRGRTGAVPQAGSLGLGLYIVQHIIRSHAGTISVSSNDLEGTTFTVDLPR